jgi:hypothetical protein
MKIKPAVFLLVLVCFLNPVFGEGIDRLAGKIADAISDSLQESRQKKASIVRFENFSDLSDQSAVKFYQILVSKLEQRGTIHFVDLMINFHNGNGTFNESAAGDVQFPVYLKLIRHVDKIGAGVVVFSRIQDRVIGLKYSEESISKGEVNILDTRSYGFREMGFTKMTEIDVDATLLDFKTVKDLQGDERYYFLYPHKIDVFGVIQNRLTKLLSVDLEWGRPYYPAIKPEGKLLVTYHDNKGYLAVGTNFSPRARLFAIEELQWQELGKPDFIPVRLATINQEVFLLGIRYAMGRNYFQDKIVVAPFVDGQLVSQRQYEKQISPHYAIDFSIAGGQLGSVHMVDREYNYQFFGPDFEPATTGVNRRGSALAALKDQWVAVSDFSEATDRDKLSFYRIDKTSRQLVYEKTVDGEIQFITSGSWKTGEGFWIFLKKPMPYRPDYKLQFWKKNEPTPPVESTGGEGGDR